MSRTLPVAAALLALPHLMAIAASRNEPPARARTVATRPDIVCVAVAPRDKAVARGAGAAAPRYLQR
ncbi:MULTISPECIES: hypothetical protein [unclassified Lysobacter]|uniref:hypothetical protein n=1 Tax=unclassified Lysobacter TaxID=2635362 RepID=UPI001BE9D9B4|nr:MULTISPECIES: hypothetical protein [unclassified Lysobacter]MBT2746703.1 hypothetical protein [Lysobacter sp. ISL-42]MBT2751752.1 hypothetical protein [Lysobacter sp. ISL-50]MBT2778104.1 hypothetical protein [Lysobacter sp. ISL-54]MBT2781745.1 hypothetical protein [Lysobacter sp. ISL-52]